MKITGFFFFVILLGLALHETMLRRTIEAAHPPKGAFVDVPTARLHYIHRAAKFNENALKDPHPVVLIHGASGNAQDMELAFFDTLAPDIDVYAFDRPGLGWSESKISAELMSSPQAQADAIAQAIDKLGLEKPVIVGFSWGGAVAAAFASEYGDKISGVVALAGVFYPWQGTDVWYQKLAEVPIINQLFMRLALVKIGQDMIPASIDATFTPEASFPDYQKLAAIDLILRPSPFIYNSVYGMRLRGHLHDMTARYADINVPLVLAAGDRDQTVYTPNQSQRLLKTVQNAHFMHFIGAGHMLHHTRNQPIVTAINDLAHGIVLPAGEHIFQAEARESGHINR
ncbi:MAG: alpha/beta fold hydrolase [Parvibaculales bacterium]